MTLFTLTMASLAACSSAAPAVGSTEPQGAQSPCERATPEPVVDTDTHSAKLATPPADPVRAHEPPPGVIVRSGSCGDVIPKLSETVSEDLRLELSDAQQQELREAFVRWIFDPSSLEPSERGLMRAHGHLDDGIGNEHVELPVSHFYCGEAAQLVARAQSDGFHHLLTSGENGTLAEMQDWLNLRCDANICCSSSLGEYHAAQGVVFDRSEAGWRVRASYIASDDATLTGEVIDRGYHEIRERFASMMKHHGCASSDEPQAPGLCESVGVFCHGPVGARQVEESDDG